MKTLQRMRRASSRRREATTFTVTLGGEAFRMRLSGAAERQAREIGGADPVPSLPRLAAAAARAITGAQGIPLIRDLITALFDTGIPPSITRKKKETDEQYATRQEQARHAMRALRLQKALKGAGISDESSVVDLVMAVLRECASDLLPLIGEILSGQALDDAYAVLHWGILGGMEAEWQADPTTTPTVDDVRELVDPLALPGVLLAIAPMLVQAYRDIPSENREATGPDGPAPKSPAPSSVAG